MISGAKITTEVAFLKFNKIELRYSQKKKTAYHIKKLFLFSYPASPLKNALEYIGPNALYTYIHTSNSCYFFVSVLPKARSTFS